MSKRTWVSRLGWALPGVLLLLGCEEGGAGSPVDAGPSQRPPWVQITSDPVAEPLTGGSWVVLATLENTGGDGEFRVVILAAADTIRLTEGFRIRSGEPFGSQSEPTGFFSRGPQRPTLMVVESRRGPSHLWMESDRAAVGERSQNAASGTRDSVGEEEGDEHKAGCDTQAAHVHRAGGTAHVGIPGPEDHRPTVTLLELGGDGGGPMDLHGFQVRR